MGGAPTIDGGMTQAEYRQLQGEERQWQSELEDKKYERALEMEQKQREYEDAKSEKMEAQKQARSLLLSRARRPSRVRSPLSLRAKKKMTTWARTSLTRSLRTLLLTPDRSD